MRRLAVSALLVLACTQAARGPLGPGGRFPAKPRDAACLERTDPAAPVELEALGDPPVAYYLHCETQHVFAAGDGETAAGEAIIAFQNRHAQAWFAELPGVSSIGMGGCCDGVGGEVPCMRVSLSACLTPAAAVARRIVDDASADGLAGQLIVGIELHGGKRRCERDDPACEPAPYSKASYWPDRSRRPVHEQVPSLGRLSGGACEHDGECREAGCGNHCVPWTEPGFAGTCEAYTALEPALCGCVERECTWFVQ